MTLMHVRPAGAALGAVVLATTGTVAAALAAAPAAGAAAPTAGTPSTTAPSTTSPRTAAGAAAATVDRRIVDPRVTESSGLARSTYPRPTLFTHNDNGDGPRVFALNKYGGTTAVLTLAGVTVRDVEDIAAGPGHRLWLADIGDNTLSRAAISVYRFTEPASLTTRTVAATRFRLRYPDGRHDAEAFLVNPRTGRLFVATKAATGARLYRAPVTLSTTRVNVLRAVAAAPAKVTAGSWGPGGRRYALGTYTTAYLYGSIGRVQSIRALPGTRQGESLEFGRDSRTLFRGSEGVDSPVFRVPL